jgi:CheY-like chemotaxis protein
MPVKILLADKSITIQKVVEMLFSGREYEVVSASDGETALAEAERAAPDVVLVDVDLPRVDGYGFSSRLKKSPRLAQVPVILMMSRDDVYDDARGKQSGILDHIAKPFESQELIGKVKKALAAAPARLAEPAAPATASSRPAPAVPSEPKPAPAPTKPKPAPAPADIFDIISEAPTQADLPKAAAPAEDESVYEVEPEVEEMEGSLISEVAKALPEGDKAMEEIRAGLGLFGPEEEPQPEVVTFESFDAASVMMPSAASPPPSAMPSPPAQQPGMIMPELPAEELRKMAEAAMAKMAKEAFEKLPSPQMPKISDDQLRSMVDEKVIRLAKDAFANMPAAPAAPAAQALSASDMWSIAEETFSRMAADLSAKQPAAPGAAMSDESVKRMVEEITMRTVKDALDTIAPPSALPEKELRNMVEASVSRMATDAFKDMAPPVPKISEDTIRRGIQEAVSTVARELAREVIEQVAWEVIPHLAEVLIKEEIERLKAEP